MKKNKKLDKIVQQAINASIKGNTLDTARANRLAQNFKKLILEDAVYALTAFKKGLSNFEAQHTLTVSAPIELPQELINKMAKSLNSTFLIHNSKFILDSSLLA